MCQCECFPSHRAKDDRRHLQEQHPHHTMQANGCLFVPSPNWQTLFSISLFISLLLISFYVYLCYFVPLSPNGLQYGSNTILLQWSDNLSRSGHQLTISNSYTNRSLDIVNHIKKSHRTKFKLILLWSDYHYWSETIKWTNCKGGQYVCYTTQNHSLLSDADAVAFYGFRHLQEIKEALSVVPRLTHQYWIYYNRESSQNTPYYNITQYEPVFNWTMTYKLDSDIVHTYAKVIPGEYLDGFNSTKNYLEGKTRTAFAVISNCFKPRLDYIQELRKYIDIDLYGRCPGYKPLCHKCWKIATKYKFYLSFENSLCTDYITEKTYTNAFTHELVPVIMSGANLSNPLLIPQGSYVDARSYSSAKELATYLMEVSNNSTLYNNFFKWRAKWKIVSQWQYKSLECSICEKLYESNDVKIYNNIYSWFNKSKECVSWLDIMN